MNNNLRNILVVAAHPDDEVLGCGGTVARLVEEGHEVYVAILGEGITSRYSKHEQSSQSMVEALHACSHKASEILGVSKLFIYDFPDNRFDSVPLLDFIKKVEKLVDLIQPHIIYTHHGGDLNIDHLVTHRAVMTATRPLMQCPVKEILAFEVPSSTEWSFGQFQPTFQANVFVDISTRMKKKIQAMFCYESEFHPYPHPRSSEGLQAIAKRWGTVVGVECAEAFQLIRSVR